jgi:hypothetical protein
MPDYLHYIAYTELFSEGRARKEENIAHTIMHKHIDSTEVHRRSGDCVYTWASKQKSLKYIHERGK